MLPRIEGIHRVHPMQLRGRVSIKGAKVPKPFKVGDRVRMTHLTCWNYTRECDEVGVVVRLSPKRVYFRTADGTIMHRAPNNLRLFYASRA